VSAAGERKGSGDRVAADLSGPHTVRNSMSGRWAKSLDNWYAAVCLLQEDVGTPRKGRVYRIKCRDVAANAGESLNNYFMNDDSLCVTWSCCQAAQLH
jgi:hypothetical protein